MRSSGSLMVIASAAAFGAMAIFGKLAFDEGTTVGTLLVARFVLAAALFWGILLVAGGTGDALRALTRRQLTLAVALGALGYAVQAGCYFLALKRIDASLLTLVLYTFPAMVAIAAVALGRERLDRRRVVALIFASAGLVLVIATAGTGALDPAGVALAFGAALTYTTYILVSESVVAGMRPLLLSALVCTGAALTLTPGTAIVGDLQPGDVTAAGWAWLACLAVVSTVAAIVLFFGGLRRVGPTTASILSTAEPVVTVGLAVAVFGESLGAWQVAGGALVLGAVMVLHLRPNSALNGRSTLPGRRRSAVQRSVGGSVRFGGRVAHVGQPALEPHDVVPPAELVADLGHRADDLEAHREVQPQARVVGHGHE